MNQTPEDRPLDDSTEDTGDIGDIGDTGGPRPGGFIWRIIPFVMLTIMALLASTLYRRVAAVDPVRRCADAYESSYTPTDTMLSDRIKVRAPDGSGRTTCGAIRATGAIRALPRRNQMKRTMPS